jgi:type II restriction enzyme
VLLNFETALGVGYSSNSQKIRVLSETWTSKNIYCPACGTRVKKFENNRPVADFYCPKCTEEFEQKSKQGTFGQKVVAGQYTSMIERLNSEIRPNFFFLQYMKTMSVTDFFVVPKSFMTPEIIEKRKPLGETARRAGWIGSTIILPKSGQIFYVKNGIVADKANVLNEWQRRTFMAQVNKQSKGWLIDVMNCISEIDKQEFSLKQIYGYEKILQALHPSNKHIRDKIRQQLQFLRDKNYIEFLERGKYRKL